MKNYKWIMSLLVFNFIFGFNAVSAAFTHHYEKSGRQKAIEGENSSLEKRREEQYQVIYKANRAKKSQNYLQAAKLYHQSSLTNLVGPGYSEKALECHELYLKKMDEKNSISLEDDIKILDAYVESSNIEISLNYPLIKRLKFAADGIRHFKVMQRDYDDLEIGEVYYQAGLLYMHLAYYDVMPSRERSLYLETAFNYLNEAKTFFQPEEKTSELIDDILEKLNNLKQEDFTTYRIQESPDPVCNIL